jgi:predicted DNA-binding transcriptional regulator AlpA
MTNTIKKKPIKFVTFKQFPEVGIPRYTRPHVNRMVEAGLFPPPVQLSAHRIAWIDSELEEWKATRPLARVPGVKGAAPQTKVHARRRTARAEGGHGS